MNTPPVMSEKFEKWKATLPKCLSYAGGCDGDLGEGLEHDQKCPMFGKKFATHLDAFIAGHQAALPSDAEIEAVARLLDIEATAYGPNETERRVEKFERVLREELRGGTK